MCSVIWLYLNHKGLHQPVNNFPWLQSAVRHEEIQKADFKSFLIMLSIYIHWIDLLGFPGGSEGKECLSAMQETWVRFLGQEYPLEEETATHTSIPAWKIPWTEKPGELHSPWGHKESDTTERLQIDTLLFFRYLVGTLEAPRPYFRAFISLNIAICTSFANIRSGISYS